jgi:anti-sigma factor RsiW
MTDHLSPSILSALADGELSKDQLAGANEHLAGCPSCTSSALFQAMLKSATSKAGQRYMPPEHLRQRVARLASQETAQSDAPSFRTRRAPAARPTRRFGLLGWATAAVLLLVSASIVLVQRSVQRSQIAAVEHAALVTEVFDQHIATLAGSLPPQVISTDRHTVKPWFQGKLPFSFNLPDNLPADTKLEGANLTYLRNQPVAQLLYSIGKHRVSVFVAGRAAGIRPDGFVVEHSGFHVRAFHTDDLEVVAVSDVDPTRLSELVSLIEQSQTGSHKQAH